MANTKIYLHFLPSSREYFYMDYRIIVYLWWPILEKFHENPKHHTFLFLIPGVTILCAPFRPSSFDVCPTGRCHSVGAGWLPMRAWPWLVLSSQPQQDQLEDLGLMDKKHHQTSNTVRCRYNAVNFLKNINKRHPIARPLGWAMGCLVDPASDWYSASVSTIINAVPYYIALRYNGTRLYKTHQIPKLECILSRLAVVFAQSIEARW